MASPFEASKIVFFKSWFHNDLISYLPEHQSILQILLKVAYLYIQSFFNSFSSLNNNFVLDAVSTLQVVGLFIFNSQYTSFFLFGLVLLFFFSRINNIDSFAFSIYYSVLIYIYGLLSDLIISYLGSERMFLFPFFYYLFLFLIFFNLCGLFPNVFVLTSHLSVTLSISFLIWFSTILNALRSRSGSFFSDFVMAGIPKPLVPILIVVEVLSFIIRLFSLALRLFANVVAGHILIHVFISVLNTLILNFVFSISIVSLFSSFFIIVLIFVLFCFEICVSLLQAYILLIIVVLYTRDIFSLTH